MRLRQLEGNDRAFTHAAFELHGPAVLLDHFLRNEETKTRAFLDGGGVIERFKNPAQGA